ncbi:hypothetical protein K2173_022455 [Erythroxylum novogranatense]|uniref:PCI domain-containing protein n=1 Tax=Erythroxylum novogranatense TaxID=1862640 RepID=A0AAV8TIZ8_9ROSI|nr:hypothetical protein K2173_022455 [Erythroxylum novogranatense]
MQGFGKAAGPTAPPSVTFGSVPPPSTSTPSGPPSFPHPAPHQPPRGSAATQRARSPFLPHQTSGLPTVPKQAYQTPRPVGSPSNWDDAKRPFKDNMQANPRPSIKASFVASRNSRTSVTAKIGRVQDQKRMRSPPLISLNGQTSSNSGQTYVQRPALSSALENRPKMLGTSPNLPDREPEESFHSGKDYRNELGDAHTQKWTRSPPILLVNETFLADAQSSKKSIRPSTSSTRSYIASKAPSSAYHSQIPQRLATSAKDNTSEAVSTRTTGLTVPKRTRSPPSITDKGFQRASNSIEDGSDRDTEAKAKRLARFKKELSEDFEIGADIEDPIASTSRLEQSMVKIQNYNGYCPAEPAGASMSDFNLSDADVQETPNIIIGLCPDMCPESERLERERKGDLDHFERVDGDRNQTDKSLAVKKYNRTADREANLIRPMPILQKTIDYLLNLLDRPYDDKFLSLYNFLWDRMRAIRMDLRMQHIFNLEAITMLEQMIRLHIMAMHELCEYTKGEGFSEGFDAHLNIEQMNKTSVELFQMYDDHRKKGINVQTEKEFRGYYALLKLDKHPGYKVEPAELSLDLAKMTPEIRQTTEILFPVMACRTGNFIAFFRLARKASYLQACLMHAHFAKLRTQALCSLHAGLQNNQGLPVAHLAKWIAMEGEDIESLLDYHGFLIKEFEEPYMVKEGQIVNTEKDYPTNCSKLVQLKRSKRIVEDVFPTPQVVPLPARSTKEIQLPKIRRPEGKIVPSSAVNGKSPVHEIDQEMPDFEAVSTPNASMQPIFQRSIHDQQRQDEHQNMKSSPWRFSSVHSSSKSQPVGHRDLDQQTHDIPSKIPTKRKMLSATESETQVLIPGLQERPTMPQVSTSSLQEKPSMPLVSRSALLGRIPSGHLMENLNSQITINSKDDRSALLGRIPSGHLMENLNSHITIKSKMIVLLIFRSSKRRQLWEQRQIAASAARSTLSLGPPIQQTTDHLRTPSKFDIDSAMRERYEKHERSWSRLNVSDAVLDILGRRNPDARCLCWKLILFTQINSLKGEEVRQTNGALHGAAGTWLSSKLIPTREDDCDDNNDLLISSPGLSIWRKKVLRQSDEHLTCCLTVVKDVKYDNLNESASGASAIVFLMSETTPWDLQRNQLYNLIMSIPSGSALPLLVLSGSYYKEISDSSSIIVRELGLHYIDQSRVSSFSIVFLLEDSQIESSDRFFSDKKLREGLQWLASESPLQPDLRCTRVRELILSHLNPSLDVLEKTSVYEVGPDHCVTAFNEALKWSMDEISTASNSYSTGWPCPEIALLDDLYQDHRELNWCLPHMGWSSSASIEPLLCALNSCKLPTFADTTSWLHKRANLDNEIEAQVLVLEDCLVTYLTESSGIMGLPLAKTEAHLMLQRSVRLELRDTTYYIVPKWVLIFRRIFNWRMSNLSSGPFSTAYVLKTYHVEPNSPILDSSVLEGCSSTSYLGQPSLDEVINASIPIPRVRENIQYDFEAFQPVLSTVSNDDVEVYANANGMEEDKWTSAPTCYAVAGKFDCLTEALNTPCTEITVSGKATKEADDLSKLLEQCNILQNSIQQKLSIYF